jgi:C-terminal processing protease CtpA/Prc
MFLKGIYHFTFDTEDNSYYTFSLNVQLFIKSIETESPAYKSGLRVNYKLVEVNGAPTRDKSYNEVIQLISKVSHRITLSVIKFKRITVKIPPSMSSFGLSIGHAKENNFKMVIKVEHYLPGDLYGIKESDIIFEIDGKDIRFYDMNTIRAILSASLKRREAEFLVLNYNDFSMLISDGYTFE